MEIKTRLFGRHHAGLAGVIEQAAGIHHGANIAERFEIINFAGRLDGNGGGIEIDGDNVAGFEDVAEAFGDFAGVQFAGGHGIAEENAGETFSENNTAFGGAQGDGGVFAGTAAAEVFASHDDGIFAIHLAFLDVADGVKGFRQAGEGVAAELFVFLGDGGDEIQKLRGNDLVSVDVIAHDVNGTGKNSLHIEFNMA